MALCSTLYQYDQSVLDLINSSSAYCIDYTETPSVQFGQAGSYDDDLILIVTDCKSMMSEYFSRTRKPYPYYNSSDCDETAVFKQAGQISANVKILGK